jgi:hypothetical protein
MGAARKLTSEDAGILMAAAENLLKLAWVDIALY